MNTGSGIAVIAGVALFTYTTGAMVTSMLVPRPRRSRLMHFTTKATAWAFRAVADRRATFRDRDSVLSIMGPASVLVVLVAFVTCYLISVTLMLFGVSEWGWGGALFQAGASLLTFGVVEPVNGIAIAISFLAALTGLVIVAVLIGYLMALYTSYTTRESQLTQLSLVAGEPAWGPELVCRTSLMTKSGEQAFNFAPWIAWLTDLRVSQTVNPVLCYYRSSGPNRHWLVSAVALLDAAGLQLTTVRDPMGLEALVLVVAEGTETIEILHGAAIYRDGLVPHRPHRPRQPLLEETAAGHNAVAVAIASDARRSYGHGEHLGPRTVDELSDPGITREEFDAAVDILRRADIPVVDDLDLAWDQFGALRARYWPSAEVLMNALYAVPAPWTGERHPMAATIWPTLAVDKLERIVLAADPPRGGPTAGDAAPVTDVAEEGSHPET